MALGSVPLAFASVAFRRHADGFWKEEEVGCWLGMKLDGSWGEDDLIKCPQRGELALVVDAYGTNSPARMFLWTDRKRGEAKRIGGVDVYAEISSRTSL